MSAAARLARPRFTVPLSAARVVLAASAGGWAHAARLDGTSALCGADVGAPMVARADVARAADELRELEGCADCWRKLRRMAQAERRRELVAS